MGKAPMSPVRNLLLIDLFQQVRRPDLPPVSLRERRKRKQVGPGVLEHRGSLPMHRRSVLVISLDGVRLCFPSGGANVGCGEDSANDEGDQILAALQDNTEHDAHEMNPTGSPTYAPQKRSRPVPTRPDPFWLERFSHDLDPIGDDGECDSGESADAVVPNVRPVLQSLWGPGGLARRGPSKRHRLLGHSFPPAGWSGNLVRPS